VLRCGQTVKTRFIPRSFSIGSRSSRTLPGAITYTRPRSCPPSASRRREK
jgi:hypothetical protein